jgi:HEAT repeats
MNRLENPARMPSRIAGFGIPRRNWVSAIACGSLLLTISTATYPSPRSRPTTRLERSPQVVHSSQVPEAKRARRTTKQRSWDTLHEGLEAPSFEKRAKAVDALGLLTANAEAEKLAIKALKDDKCEVRTAAAGALGSMHAVRAIPDLEKALDDSEPKVVLAAANSLLTLKDAASAYDIYYGVLTGSMRTDRGLVQEQLKTLHDSKKLAELGFQEGIGFVPFGGLGYGLAKTVMKSEQSTMRAFAAKKLAHDPDSASAAALVAALQDRSAIVRVAAIQALSERGDKSLLPEVAFSLDDDRDEVRYNAAACIIHLNEVPQKHRAIAVSGEPSGQ